MNAIPALRPALILALALAAVTTPLPVRGASGDNTLGLELSYVLQPTGATDPYSGPLGLAVFYERHNLLAGMFAAARLAAFGFYPLGGDFGDSYMLVPLLGLGYDFLLPVDRRFTLAVSPYALGGLYWRRFVYSGQAYDARRPLVAVGLRTDLHLARRLLIGINVELLLVLDEALLVTFGQGERLGVRF